MTSELYPLKFQTIFKEKIWGGQKIKKILGKDIGNLNNCGETWELSGVKGNVSLVSNGSLAGIDLNQLIKKYGAELMGQKIITRFGNEFPLLIKFIDAAEDLSIQVHPDDDLARKRHNGFGKTEMWHILQADKNSTLISGFNKQTNREEYLDFFESGRLMELLNSEKAEQGDVFFLPAGRIHTIGKGLLLAEIQQTSDITYRIYDFDRVDKEGNRRTLHLEESLDALDFNFYEKYKTDYSKKKNTENKIISSTFFTTNKFILDKPLTLDRFSQDCFKIYICTAGTGIVEGENLKTGEVLLVPANKKFISIEPKHEFELLETYIE